MAGAREKGFGTGLRAQLEKKQAEGSAPPEEFDPPEARSVSEAIAVATLQAEGVTELKAELEASRAREQELRASLTLLSSFEIASGPLVNRSDAPRVAAITREALQLGGGLAISRIAQS